LLKVKDFPVGVGQRHRDAQPANAGVPNQGYPLLGRR
jgi:hypothetical protein